MSDAVVIIPAHNEAEHIRVQLAALDRQTDLDFEIVVSDNGSTDGTAQVCRTWDTRALGGIRVVDAGARQGVSFARNVAIKATTQPLILICDADDRVHPDWAARMRDGLADADGATGPLLAFWEDDPTQLDVRQPVNLPTCEGFPYLSGGNLGIHRYVFDELGGFDESLILGQEDVDFGWRADAAGFRLKHCGAAVDYLQSDTALEACRKQFRYGRGLAQLKRKHHLPANRRTALRWFWEWAKQFPRADHQAAVSALAFQLGAQWPSSIGQSEHQT